jgi:hypothetical protein
MCYSAQIKSDYRKYIRAFGADLSLRDYVDLFWRRRADSRIKIPKAMEIDFADSQNDEERQIRELIDAFNAAQAITLEQELFKQRKRLVEAERTLQTRTTKAAAESKRIATEKVEWALGKLAALRRTELTDEDARIFPGWYAPVMIWEEGGFLVKPMRYQCRPAGKPVNYDFKFPGTYNARRDNLEGFWKGQFGVSHGVMIATCSTRTSRPTAWRAAILDPASRWRTWSSSSDPVRPRTCWWRACGRAGPPQASPTCCRSPPSPTSHRRRWQPQGTTAASSRSRRRTSNAG